MDTQFGKFPSLSQDELKEFVLGWCDNKLFSSEHIARMARGYENDEWVNSTRVVFLPVSFGCLDCPVKRPEEPEKAPQELLDAIEWGEDSEDSLEPYKEAQALYERELELWEAIDRAWGKHLAENIGVDWESYDQSLPLTLIHI